MRYFNIFRELSMGGGRMGFFTKETSDQIPEVDGCYAWMLPLWIYRDDLDELLAVVTEMLCYDPSPEKELDANFNWDRVNLRVRRSVTHHSTPRNTSETWRGLISENRSREALQHILLEASLLMPPLYVGKTDNLKRRYLQHVQGNKQQNNDFHTRFTQCTVNAGLAIEVSDLLFVCIKTPTEIRNAFNARQQEHLELNELVERIMMQLCRPPFSLK